jgi:hypothetical protein
LFVRYLDGISFHKVAFSGLFLLREPIPLKRIGSLSGDAISNRIKGEREFPTPSIATSLNDSIAFYIQGTNDASSTLSGLSSNIGYWVFNIGDSLNSLFL